MSTKTPYRVDSITANGLAASFRERVNEHGWTWITAKQVKFLRSLIGREHPEHVDRGGSATRTGIVMYRHHGWPIIEGPGWQVTEYHNGSGLFKVLDS